MIVNEEFLGKLRNYFSLNLYEVKIWTALLSRGTATAGELSDIANVPRSRSYDVLESLEKKGFVIMKFGKPIKYYAVPPEEVISRVKKNLRKETEKQIKKIENAASGEILKELNMLHSQGVELVEPSERSGSLKGRHNLYNHFEFLMKGAERTVTIVSTAQELIRISESIKEVLESVAKRGVKIRIATSLGKSVQKAVNNLKGIAEIREMKGIMARFIVIDGRELTFMLHNDEDIHPSFDVGIWVNTEFFASALENLFELAWREMKPLKVKAEK
jgi:sugar-specific transcriptional regulator TrmB